MKRRKRCENHWENNIQALYSASCGRKNRFFQVWKKMINIVFCSETQADRTTGANDSRSFKMHQKHLFFTTKPAVVATSRKKFIKGSLKISVGECFRTRIKKHRVSRHHVRIKARALMEWGHEVTGDLRHFEASNWDDCRILSLILSHSVRAVNGNTEKCWTQRRIHLLHICQQLAGTRPQSLVGPEDVSYPQQLAKLARAEARASGSPSHLFGARPER